MSRRPTVVVAAARQFTKLTFLLAAVVMAGGAPRSAAAQDGPPPPSSRLSPGATNAGTRDGTGEVAYGITATTQATAWQQAGGGREGRGGDDVARGDSLLRRGWVLAAESAYYDAARHTPRDPAARLALGRYLAARGALRIGAVLMEEARFFGGDPRAVAAELAPVYARLGDYRSLAALPASPLTAAERARAEWLRDHAPDAKGPDSVRVAYAPDAGGPGTLGRVTLTLGGEAVEASIDPAVRGLVLDTAWARRADVTKTFGARQSGSGAAPAVGAALVVKVGELTLSNVPARFAAQPGSRSAARIGLDVLGALAPAFDERARTLTLRRGGRVARELAGDRLPTVTLAGGVWLASPALATGSTSSASASLASERARALLRGTRWTVDARRGEIVVER